MVENQLVRAIPTYGTGQVVSYVPMCFKVSNNLCWLLSNRERDRFFNEVSSKKRRFFTGS